MNADECEPATREVAEKHFEEKHQIHESTGRCRQRFQNRIFEFQQLLEMLSGVVATITKFFF